MKGVTQSDVPLEEVELEEGIKVFTDDGFGVVQRINDVGGVMVMPIRESKQKMQVHKQEDVEIIDEREWIVYEEGVVETPWR